MTCDCATEEITVIQNQNRALRRVNKLLRNRLRATLEECDFLFEMLLLNRCRNCGRTVKSNAIPRTIQK